MYYNKVEICGVNTSELKVLTDEEKRALLLRTKQGDEEARQELIYGNLRLVLSIIQRFTGRRENLDDLFRRHPEAAAEAWLTTTKAPRSYQEAEFTPDSWLFFGKETAGLPMDFREKFRDRCIRLPMVSEARSLNLSNTVAVCVYEALRQTGFPGLLGIGEMAED